MLGTLTRAIPDMLNLQETPDDAFALMRFALESCNAFFTAMPNKKVWLEKAVAQECVRSCQCLTDTWPTKGHASSMIVTCSHVPHLHACKKMQAHVAQVRNATALSTPTALWLPASGICFE